MKLLISLFFLCLACTPKHEINHLKGERSLHLQKSQNDEIWWYPWGQAPLEYAKNNDQLIYLSIGYASCFSCERMHKEIYSDSEVAEKLNASFVTIKVDREERPDLDAYFLNMQTAIMKFGAWPINLFLTPDLKPVFATTYMKKANFLKLLNQLEAAWKRDKEKILAQSSDFLKRIEPIDEQAIEFETTPATLIALTHFTAASEQALIFSLSFL